MSKRIGRARRDLHDWMCQTWIEEGPAVCFLQGFPGTGKSDLARDVAHSCQQRKIPAAIAEATSSNMTLEDVLFAWSGPLATSGAPALSDAIITRADLLTTIELMLRNPLLIVLDEAQHLFHGTSGKPGGELTKLLGRLKNTSANLGRLLVVIDRKLDAPEWSEVFEVRELHKLDLKEATELLGVLLASVQREDEVPIARRRSIAVALDGNPRALQSLVGCLAYESLDAILGDDPGLWSVGDRTIAARLVEQLENRLLEKTLSHLDDRPRHFLQSLSVHRKPFQRSAMDKLATTTELEMLIEVLVQRFLLRQVSGLYTINPIAREISVARLRQKPASLRSAHNVAADYHLGPFKARRLTGDVKILAPRFAELRYHLANAQRAGELHEAIQRFALYLRSAFGTIVNLPVERETIDEQIAVLTVILEEPGAVSLEHYLARLLDIRRGPNDLSAACEHARRAAVPGGPIPNWLLRIRLEQETNGIPSALTAVKEAFKLARDADIQPELYLRIAEILGQDGRFGEALSYLEQGLLYVPRQNRRVIIYRFYGELLAKERGSNAALEFLTNRALLDIPSEQNAFSLYELCAELRAQQGDLSAAIAQLREAFDKIPVEKGLVHLYQMAARLLVRADDIQGAQSIYKEGRDRLRSTQTANILIEQSLLLCASTDDRSGLEAILKKEELPIAQVLYGRTLLAIVDNDWKGADKEVSKAMATTGHLRTLAAFCALAVKAFKRAEALLRNLAPGQANPRWRPIYWLRALVALKLGDDATAMLNTRAFIGDPNFPASKVNLTLLLQLWDESGADVHGVSTSFIFPKLPSSITGFDKTITRPPSGGPILPEIEKILSSPATDRAQTRTGPIIFFVATEWWSAHGGLSTFNRHLAESLSRSGSHVFCYVPRARDNEIEAASRSGVVLLQSPDQTSEPATALLRRPPLPDGVVPAIIIGHDRITGPAAAALREDFYPSSKFVLFIHTAPREIEWYKEPGDNETRTEEADTRARLQKQVALKADVVAAVGPRLFSTIQTELVGESRHPLVTRIDPGLNVGDQTLNEPQIVNCLVSARAEDDRIKGLDIAARAVGILRSRPPLAGGRHAQLIVRGATTGSGDDLRYKLISISQNAQLHIDVRPFIADVDQIRAEMRSAWCVLMPSRAEGFGLAALEAVGEGLPVLVGEESGLASLIRAQCPDIAENICVPFLGSLEADAIEWANRIEFVLRDRSAALQRATALRNRLALMLSWDRAAAELLAAVVNS